MPYGEGQAYNQEEFSGMFGEKQGYDNGGVQGEQGGLGQLLIMLLMKMLGGGGTANAQNVPDAHPAGLMPSLGMPPAHTRIPAQGPPVPPVIQEANRGLQPSLQRRPAPGGMPQRIQPMMQRVPQVMPQGGGGRGNPLQALMGLLGGGR
jgi:hypothetical protein